MCFVVVTIEKYFDDYIYLFSFLFQSNIYYIILKSYWLNELNFSKIITDYKPYIYGQKKYKFVGVLIILLKQYLSTISTLKLE